jgi:hypothetical protein
VMRFEQIAPALVAQLLRPRGRTHDVRKQYGRWPSAAEIDPVKNSSIASQICSWIKKR